ncbi:hypothetical protein GCM10020216_014120 [Nonomuraea helvata]
MVPLPRAARHRRSRPRRSDVRGDHMSDIRMVIGGLFLLYGVILVVAGALGSAVNLWTGLAMAVFGGTFVAWARLRRL